MEKTGLKAGEIYEYTLPAFWASAIFNDDYSGVSDDDELEIKTFLAEHFRMHCCEVSDEPFFGQYKGIGHDLLVYKFMVNRYMSPYVETIVEENQKLDIVDFNEDCVLAVDPETRKAHFFYWVNDDLSFQFNMLCEVGAPYQPFFNESIERLNYKLEPKDTGTDYYEILIKV